MRLIVAEVRRFLLRRLVRWLVLATVLVMAAVAGMVAFYSHRPNAVELAQHGTVDAVQPYSFDLANESGVMLMLFAMLMTLLALIIGASFVGAEWTNGGMLNLLLWHSSRLKVLGAKLAVALIGMLGVTLALGAVWAAMLWSVAYYDGTVGHLAPGVAAGLGWLGLRVMGLVLLVAALAVGLATLGRNTAAALGGVVGLFLLSEVGLRIMLRQLETDIPERYLLLTHVHAWLTGSVTLHAGDYQQMVTVTWQQSGLVFGSIVALALVVAAWTTQRREIS